MEGALDGRIAVITGAGRGLGREHALLFAREGARVLVNDVGSFLDGSVGDPSVAAAVVEEIRSLGGEAIANTESVSDWHGAERMIRAAIESFGDLHILVNNAGFIRDRMFVNLTEAEWDSVIQVHLKGHAAPSRWAATYWREQMKTGRKVAAAIVNTSSHAGLVGQMGQSNYAAAKAGIAALTINQAIELAQYGVRANAISPAARTRLTEATAAMSLTVAPPAQEGEFDTFDPGNISPLVAYLASESCSLTGKILWIKGGEITLMHGWSDGPTVSLGRRWTVAELAVAIPQLQADVRP